MPPPFQHKAFHLTLLPNIYFVKQLPAPTELSGSVLSLLNGTTFFSITRAAEDITIVGELTDNPEIQSLSGGTGDWRCIKIAGPMEFGKPSIPVSDIMFRVSKPSLDRNDWRRVWSPSPAQSGYGPNIRHLDLVSSVSSAVCSR
jgi:hypothetical protein